MAVLPINGKEFNFKDYTSAKVYTHWMPWFGTPGHIRIGYNSADVWTCDAQCSNMQSLGISGVNADYYGPDSPSAQACLTMLDSCDRAGLGFFLCVDIGALGKLVGMAATTEYIRILKFASEAFFPNPAYLQDAGRYFVSFFNEPAGVDWKAVRAAIPAKMAFIFQGGSGFVHAESDGSFGWVNPLPDAKDCNIRAIQAFSALATPGKIAFYPAYAGFDDSMAFWGKSRFMSRRLGQTLLDTLAQVPKNAAFVINPTFNDHEEGSAIEYSQG
jgi:hypothetical protein